jgi:Spy/CpxP family protein refolding chaperone
MHKIGATLLTLTLLAGFTLAAQTAAPATPPPSAAPQTPAAEPTPQDQAHQAMEKIGSDLNLTADQKTKLEPIIAGEIQQVRDLRADTSMTPEQKQAKFQQTLSSDHAKIDSILTPEQKEKLAQLRQQQAQPPQPQASPKPEASQPPK